MEVARYDIRSRSSYTSSGVICRTLPVFDDAALSHRMFSTSKVQEGVAFGGTNKSLIFGGGALAGGPIFRIVLVSYDGSGRRSGEFPPCCILPSGTRAGIFDGVLPPVVETELPIGFRLIVPAGVAVADREGGYVRMTLPVRDDDGAGPDFSGTFCVVDAGPEGVFDLGGKLFAAAAANSSRYRTPWTKKGRP